ncbi:MAG TPA: AMP-binding protein, partial [Solirubrobacterales bacterium]|nr:AMP-binding protein [Solirubrobacterales bacterium]
MTRHAPIAIGQMIADQARFGERTALVAGGRRLTYAELLERAERLAAGLRELGVEPGQRFAFLLPNGFEIVTAYYGCALSGIVGVPLATRLTDEDLVHQLADSGAVAVLFDEQFASRVETVHDRAPGVRHWIGFAAVPGAISPEGVLAGAAPESSLGGAVVDRLDDPFCVMFTGGTTGVSKAAIQTQRAWGACIADTVEQLGIEAGDRHAVVLPMTHAAWFTAAAHLAVGAETHLLERWDPVALLELTEAVRLTKLHMMPTLLGDLLTALGERPTDVSSVGLLSLAGSPIPLDLYRRARAAFGEVIANIYGLTEAAGPVTYLVPAELNEDRLRSGGRTGRYVEIEIADEGADEEGHTVGEVRLRGPQLTPGYLNRSEETAAAYEGEWFCTGDIGYLDEDGFLFIVDRKKDMVKTGGFNVYPKEIEEVLYE